MSQCETLVTCDLQTFSLVCIAFTFLVVFFEVQRIFTLKTASSSFFLLLVVLVSHVRIHRQV